MKKYRVDKDDRQGDVRDRAGRRRDRVARHGDRRELGGRALDDGDRRPRHLADGRVRRPRRTTPRCPAVIFDVQRVGPSTGLPTRTAQGDLLSGRVPLARRHQAHHAHSRARSRSATRWRMEAFDLAEQFQTPVFVMMRPRPRHEQLDVGRRSRIPTKPINRGKLLDAGDAEASSASGAATRTSTATASRTARCRATACRPTSRAARATTRRGSTASGRTTTSSNMDRLARKFETARTLVPTPVVEHERRRRRSASSRYGTSHWAIEESRDQLREETERRDVVLPAARAIRSPTELDDVRRRARARLRRRAEPRRADAAADEARAHAGAQIAKLRSVLHYNGLPIDARSITDDVLAQEGFEVAKKTAAPRRARGTAGGE